MLTCFKQIYRSALKNPAITAISVSGFALSSAILIILLAFISSERSYDKDIPDVQNIYRVLADGKIADIPEDAAYDIIKQIPGVLDVSNYYIGYKPVIFSNKSYPSKLVCTDSNIFKMLGVEVIDGSLKDFHTVPNQVVLTKSFSEKVFNGENPIGQEINLSYKENVVVAAIIKDFPINRSFDGQVFCSTKLKVTYSQRGWEDKSTYLDKLLIKLRSGASKSEIENQIKPIINKLFYEYEYKNYSYTLSPYKEAYFTPIDWDGLKHANVKLIDLLSWLAVCIFVFAIFNYINFSIAKISIEIKNVGIHQVLGASKFGIFRRFVLEAQLQLIASILISIFLIFIFKPLFEEVLGQKILFESLLTSIPLILSIVISFIMVAILVGSYPAYVALKANPGNLLKNKEPDLQKKRYFRVPLNVIQFAASIVAVVSFITIHRQIDFVKNQDLGFDTEQLVRVSVHHKIKEHIPALMDKIGALPGVKSICPTHGTPWEIYSFSENEELGRFSEINSDNHFLETFNVKLIEGRNFFEGETESVLINKTGMQQLGWNSFEGKKIFGAEIVGVIDDFHFMDLHNPIGALIIRNGEGLSHLNIRLYPGDISGTLKQVENNFDEIAGNFSFEYQFYDEWMDGMYRKEENQAKSIQYVSILAMLLAVFGMHGLASYSLKKRTKEMGIRKVTGAKTFELLSLLNKDFIKYVALAFVIACPIAWFVMHKWLENFAYKTELSWWVFALAGLLAIGVALLTVSWQTWRTARRNPVEALRYE